jgi:hypothetical protein
MVLEYGIYVGKPLMPCVLLNYLPGVRNLCEKATDAMCAAELLACLALQLLDVKLYIKSGSTTIAKTQIPVWDIPTCDKHSSSGVESPAGPTISAAAEAAVRAIRTSTDSTATIPSTLQIKKAASVALSGLQAGSCDSLGIDSAPGTPRRRLSIAAGEHGQLLQDMFAYTCMLSKLDLHGMSCPGMAGFQDCNATCNLLKEPTVCNRIWCRWGCSSAWAVLSQGPATCILLQLNGAE